MNFADPQPAVSTLSTATAASKPIPWSSPAPAFTHGTFDNMRATGAGPSELTRRFTMLSELEISKISMRGLDTPVDERLPIVCGPVTIAAVTGAPMSVRFLHPQRRCREGQTEE
jgi:hypothetical protein